MNLNSDPIFNHFNSIKLKKEKNDLTELIKIVTEKDQQIKSLNESNESLQNDLRDLDNILSEYRKMFVLYLSDIVSQIKKGNNEEDNNDSKYESQILDLKNRYINFKNKNSQIYDKQ